MPVFALNQALAFPPPEQANEDGLLAVGGDLSPERLLMAYCQGIFPWYSEDLPILWFSPDPRMVLRPGDLRVSRSLRKRIRQRPYSVRSDTAFRQVIEACAAVPRGNQDGTWITSDMIDGYCGLHRMGLAHSVEAWRGDELVGGLYGVCLGGVFCGESMFARAPDASKIAFVTLNAQLQAWGVELVDCQVHTEHLERFGAREIPRAQFLDLLVAELEKPTRQGLWTLELDPEQALAWWAARS